MSAQQNKSSMALAVHMSERRAALGMTQTALARACDMSRASISNIEACNQQVTLAALDRIAEALHTTADNLIRDNPSPKLDVEARLLRLEEATGISRG